MSLKHLAAAAAATALMTGAAYAQPSSTPEPDESTQVSPSAPTSETDPSAPTPGPEASPSTSPTDAQPSTSTSSTSTDVTAPTAQGPQVSATVSTTLTTNGPVPDTEENRAKYGEPLSRAGRMTEPAGN